MNALSKQLEGVYLAAARYPKGDFVKPNNLKIFWLPLLDVPFVDELFFMFAAFFKVVFIKELRSVDVVDSVGPRGLLAGWYLKRRFRVPLVCTIEMLNERGRLVDDLYYTFVRFLLTRAPVDKFICWSNYYWENHLKRWGITGNKVAVIPGGIDTEAYNPNIDGSSVKEKYSPERPLVVFAKPLYSTNIEAAQLLVRALAALKSDLEMTLLVGGGEGRPVVESLAESLGVSSQVNFMPPTPFPEIPKYIAAADLIVLPFTYAPTTSRSLLEAMAMGKPIVTTPVGEVKRMLKDRDHAVFAEPVPKKIATAIKEVLLDRELSAKIGANARCLVEEKFSLPAVVQQTVGVFEDLKQ